MALVLEIEHLTGVAFAAVGPDSDAPDWPPQPDRVFSALVASWAARGRRDDERRALEWLERQDVPEIVASDAWPRTAPVSFVPPNDPQTRKTADRGVMPALRRRQPRRFPAARPADAVVRLLWPGNEPDVVVLSALDALAAATAYVGHSASLTRCRFVIDTAEGDSSRRRTAARRVYPGRLNELERAFLTRRRPGPGERVGARPQPGERPLESVFSPAWLVFEHVGGAMPDIRAAALVAKAIRDAILDGYGRIGIHGERIPAVVSGHAADGAPTRDPHLAIVPLAFAGFAHADGQVLGFALVPPRGSGILDDPAFRAAIGALGHDDEDTGRPIVEIGSRGAGDRDPTRPGDSFRVRLSPTFEPDRRSLDPARYRGPARDFATVTPLVLDRHPKRQGAALIEEIAASIGAACRNIGLPEPEAVVPDKHSAIEGAASARPSGHAPSWTRWRLPAALASRPLTHAVLRFPVPVEGPVVLGAGRFLGMGLCLPIDTKRPSR